MIKSYFPSALNPVTTGSAFSDALNTRLPTPSWKFQYQKLAQIYFTIIKKIIGNLPTSCQTSWDRRLQPVRKRPVLPAGRWRTACWSSWWLSFGWLSLGTAWSCLMSIRSRTGRFYTTYHAFADEREPSPRISCLQGEAPAFPSWRWFSVCFGFALVNGQQKRPFIRAMEQCFDEWNMRKKWGSIAGNPNSGVGSLLCCILLGRGKRVSNERLKRWFLLLFCLLNGTN